MTNHLTTPHITSLSGQTSLSGPLSRVELTSSSLPDCPADQKSARSPQLILDRRFRKTGPRGNWRLMRSASESPTFVAFTLALFVFWSAVSMMTAAQKPHYVEAHLQSAPFFNPQAALESGGLKSDEYYGDFSCAGYSTFAAFDYTAFRDAMRIGRKTSHARHFDARGPPTSG
jgi:hypothetical protein